MCFLNTYLFFVILIIIYKLIISIFAMCHNFYIFGSFLFLFLFFYIFTTNYISLMFCREQMLFFFCREQMLVYIGCAYRTCTAYICKCMLGCLNNSTFNNSTFNNSTYKYNQRVYD